METQARQLSPWVTLMERTVGGRGFGEASVYHSLSQADYVSVVAVTTTGRIPLVKQFRPALQRVSLELPGGLRDGPERPEETARRELREETGLSKLIEIKPLGCLSPDSGRLENRLWGFFATLEDEIDDQWLPEQGIEVAFTTTEELRSWIKSARFDHALHIALIGLALIEGYLKWEE